MLVGLAQTQTSKMYTNKCVDGSTHYRIKVTKIVHILYIGTSLNWSSRFCSVLGYPHTCLFWKPVVRKSENLQTTSLYMCPYL